MTTADRIRPSAQLRDTGVMAILRARTADRFAEVSRTLVDAGITCLEITLTSPGAVDAIRAIRQELPDTVDVGAGTVTDAAQARAVVEAGAGFVVSPSVEPDVVAVAREAGIPAYPGAFTPTEVLAAWRAGASVVKLFPGSAVGPSYISALHGPFPDIEIMPTGGVSLDNIGDWIRAGAAGVGLGGPLLGDAADGGDLGALAERAAKALAAVRDAKAGAA
ncbi:bifunctional 4-hydroxy-2-oxoglutarate aldolase/2-dehydro-3-deoxy-phosphogluconate aldolase [Jiangella asiatica]|uniref:Bifunctional 4-hydroxy-2-oxoglutarate aldolase/2-dehydro-3-deoxy-phosphogluconate aldolase n=1 Tax=Jiangella asiatica TaxID=2530372 RepID=A0A4R5D482_9ACTN|nr:bifunctional 4-hydroxy-2-oxoglutarate aldolase/2-dehydro-3-deoxy-phosphogluconate aldolase [Jiangella asiatica]TDE08086.1 bifunctional 4-hydroxy-2-oxoglutarate aldolase/2-dehydro-3-deoxy-phosphogluconate aldolase [Jiangella asiatica]